MAKVLLYLKLTSPKMKPGDPCFESSLLEKYQTHVFESC